MAKSKFPNEVWDGLTSDRAFTSTQRWVDQNDWEQLVAEVQAAQAFILAHPLSLGNFPILMGLNPNP